MHETQSTAAPLTTSASSSDSLPQKGYNIEQLARYIERQLGSPTWIVELPKQNIIDCINDALGQYSQYRPQLRFGCVQLQRGIFKYLEGVDMGEGPIYVDFVQPNPVPVELFWGNLIDPVPLLRNGMADLDSFMRWQKTWMRVTSVKPDWVYDVSSKTLLIYNPLDRYQCGLQYYGSFTDTRALDSFGAIWVKNYSFQKARHQYAELLNKYSGSIPGPLKDLQMDTSKRDLAKAEMDKLEAQLFNAQTSTPITID